MRTIIVVILFFYSFVYAKEMRPRKPKVPPGSYAIADEKGYQILKVKKTNGVQVSANCVAKCLALKSLQEEKPFPKAPHSAMQHPAASYCASVGGKNLIAINESGGEENFCNFTDGTYVNSWDLFYNHFPK